MTDQSTNLLVSLSAASDLISSRWERWAPRPPTMALLSSSDLAEADLDDRLFERLAAWTGGLVHWESILRKTGLALEKLWADGTTSVPINDSRYPPQLRAISFPPLVLHVRGKLGQQIPTGVAIVGSRSPPDESVDTTKSIAAWFSSQRVPVITGMARGIDRAAARGTQDAGGTLVGVVPGTPLDIIPSESVHEYRRAYESGLIISETTGIYPVDRSSFLRRNRIISGLARFVMVTSTRATGGTINQLEWARRQGRPSVVLDAGADPDFRTKVPTTRIPYHFIPKSAMRQKSQVLWSSPELTADSSIA